MRGSHAKKHAVWITCCPRQENELKHNTSEMLISMSQHYILISNRSHGLGGIISYLIGLIDVCAVLPLSAVLLKQSSSCRDHESLGYLSCMEILLSGS